MTHTPPAPAPLADVLAGMPDVCQTLIEAHVPDRHGHCTTCRHTVSGSAHRWPCTLHTVASQARRLAERAQRVDPV